MKPKTPLKKDSTQKAAKTTQNQPDPEPSGVFEVGLFPPDVESVHHPYAEQFKEILEEVAQTYDCRLLHFEVHKGTARFSFDSDRLNAEIVRMLKRDPDR